MHKTTVLLTLMKLDIGGAETHVVDLARHLTGLGYRTLVASNGGVFVEKLAACGVPHYQVPLHSKRPDLLWRSIQAMRRIVRDEQVGLIHAHARIPAFVAEIMGRPKQVRFITTAHYPFRGLRRLSPWGERTIAVSEDIRDYLIDYFRVAPGQIVVIPNGVDTDLFRPGDQPALDPESPGRVDRITMVSRLDGNLADVAVNLISACEQVYGRWPLQLEIVGDGDNIGVVTARAAALNGMLKRKVVSVLGARTDINRILAGSDLVVGVSRVAMEAMSCARPVILAGPQGFGGLLEPDMAGRFKEDNFTARRQNTAVTVPGLAAALEEFFGKPPGWRSSTGHYLRQLVISEYSSLKMAERVAEVYEQALAGPAAE
jgi:glycosyltransferase involved in cell wall biosynthesis